MAKLSAELAKIPAMAFQCTLNTSVLNKSSEDENQLLLEFFKKGYPIRAVYIARQERQLSVELFKSMDMNFVEFLKRMANTPNESHVQVADAISQIPHSSRSDKWTSPVCQL